MTPAPLYEGGSGGGVELCVLLKTAHQQLIYFLGKNTESFQIIVTDNNSHGHS